MGLNVPAFQDGPIEIDWEVNAADDWRKYFTIKKNGIPQDVSGWEWGGTIVRSRESAILIAELDWITTDAGVGIVGYQVSYPATKIDRGAYWYELDYKRPDLGRRSFQCGVLRVGFSHSEIS